MQPLSIHQRYEPFRDHTETKMTRIVVLAGQAGHGKDTAADVFVEHGFIRAPLAGPLKEMLKALIVDVSRRPALAEAAVNGVCKEEPLEELGGRTPRYAMQTLGTEWGRKLFGEKFWLDIWKRKFTVYYNIVVTDCRFENEGAYLKALGAELYVVRRPGFTKNVAAHSSEDLDWAAGEEVIWNDGYPTAGDFQDSVRARFFS